MPGRKFTKEHALLQEKYPNYFKAVSENEILLIENVYKNKVTKELINDYSIPNDVISLLDIPLQIGGELVGIMCFEKKGKKQRIFKKTNKPLL